MKASESNTTAAEILAELEARDDCNILNSNTQNATDEWPTLEIEIALQDNDRS